MAKLETANNVYAADSIVEDLDLFTQKERIYERRSCRPIYPYPQKIFKNTPIRISKQGGEGGPYKNVTKIFFDPPYTIAPLKGVGVRFAFSIFPYPRFFF